MSCCIVHALTCITPHDMLCNACPSLSHVGGVDFIGDDNFTIRAGSRSATFTVKIVDNSVFTGSAFAQVFYIILNSTDPIVYQVENTTSLTEISIVDDDCK